MTNQYYQTITSLEASKVSKEYILGWASGFLGNPRLEEQRITESWEAGYNDGKGNTTENADSWK